METDTPLPSAPAAMLPDPNATALATAQPAASASVATQIPQPQPTNGGPFRLPIASVSVNGIHTLPESIVRIGNTMLNVFTLIAGVLAVFFLIWSGLRYITSAGNADRAKAARAGIINVIIGVIVIVSTYFIVRVAVSIGNTLSSSTP